MRKTNHLQIITFGLQRAAGPYRRASSSARADFDAGHPRNKLLPPHPNAIDTTI
jgi:hypothetical protein